MYKVNALNISQLLICLHLLACEHKWKFEGLKHWFESRLLHHKATNKIYWFQLHTFRLLLLYFFFFFFSFKPAFSWLPALPTFYIYHYISGYSLYPPAHIKFSTIAHLCEPVSAVIVIHKPLSAPGIGPSWQPRSMLRLSNRHYVNWHVQCNSLIRLN